MNAWLAREQQYLSEHAKAKNAYGNFVRVMMCLWLKWQKTFFRGISVLCARVCVRATGMCIRQICFESNRPRQNNSAANTFVYLHIEFMKVLVFIYSFIRISWIQSNKRNVVDKGRYGQLRPKINKRRVRWILFRNANPLKRYEPFVI